MAQPLLTNEFSLLEGLPPAAAAGEAARRCNFMGCPVDDYTWDELLAAIHQRITRRNGTSLIHFLNVGKIVKAAQDAQLRKVLWEGDFVLADGRPLLPLGRGLGLQLPEQIAGIDLMMRLLTVGQEKGYRIYLLGAKQAVLEGCAARIRETYPGLHLVGCRNGYFDPGEIPEIIWEINVCSPDILFIGMPTPRKEFFAHEHRHHLKVPIVQGVGGSFDVIAGLVPRAPRWMQERGLEWLYRVIQEPRRMFWRYFSSNNLFLLRYAWHFSGYQYQTKVQQRLRTLKSALGGRGPRGLSRLWTRRSKNLGLSGSGKAGGS